MTSLHLFLQNPSTGVCLPPPLETTASRDLGLGRAHRKHSTSAETKSLQGGMTCSRHLPMELASTQVADEYWNFLKITIVCKVVSFLFLDTLKQKCNAIGDTRGNSCPVWDILRACSERFGK
ncbi:PREDICTED: uncharacterized protein LOC106723607 isoform X4 [Myotis brandtii]|uniref:uncharacterized protein LOC106723607 isoform X4 n=1 Tax=Myotis brandtii TaxID=109478 RepID=UPI0007044582|nr:PREDICTED: uncharacterized protein LOC106723607 isoform X4 [Myotis brandtii]